jgi:hypothetical protein
LISSTPVPYTGKAQLALVLLRFGVEFLLGLVAGGCAKIELEPEKASACSRKERNESERGRGRRGGVGAVGNAGLFRYMGLSFSPN